MKEFKIQYTEKGNRKINGEEYMGAISVASKDLSRYNIDLGQLNSTAGNYDNFSCRPLGRGAKEPINFYHQKKSARLNPEMNLTFTNRSSVVGQFQNKMTTYASSQGSITRKSQVLNNSKFSSQATLVGQNLNPEKQKSVLRYLNQNLIDASQRDSLQAEIQQSNDLTQNSADVDFTTNILRPKTQPFQLRRKNQNQMQMKSQESSIYKTQNNNKGPAKNVYVVDSGETSLILDLKMLKELQKKKKQIFKPEDSILSDTNLNSSCVHSPLDRTANLEQSLSDPTAGLFAPSSQSPSNKIVKHIQLYQQYSRQEEHRQNQEDISRNFKTEFFHRSPQNACWTNRMSQQNHQSQKLKKLKLPLTQRSSTLGFNCSLGGDAAQNDPKKSSARQSSVKAVQYWRQNCKIMTKDDDLLHMEPRERTRRIDQLMKERVLRHRKGKQSQMAFVNSYEVGEEEGMKAIKEGLIKVFQRYQQQLEKEKLNQSGLNEVFIDPMREDQIQNTVQAIMQEGKINIKESKVKFRNIYEDSWYYWQSLKGTESTKVKKAPLEEVPSPKMRKHSLKSMRGSELKKEPVLYFDQLTVFPKPLIVLKTMTTAAKPAEEPKKEEENKKGCGGERKVFTPRIDPNYQENQRVQTPTRKIIDGYLRQSIKQYWQKSGDQDFYSKAGSKTHRNRRQELLNLQDIEIKIEELNIKKYGRFRYLVAKHFLTKSLEQIDAQQRGSISIRQVTKMILLLETLDEVFSPGQIRLNQLGKKYVYVCVNLYANTYLRDRQQVLLDATIDDDLSFARQTCNQNYLVDMNKLLRVEAQKHKFFQEAKKITPLLADDLSQQSMQIYSQTMQKGESMVKPCFISLLESTVILREMTLNSAQANALRKLFELAMDSDEYQIRQVVIDTCNCSDSDLASIFSGLEAHGKLKSLSLSNSALGEESSTELCHLLRDLNEIRLNNLKIHNKELISKTLQHMQYQCRQLQMIQIKNINLDSVKTVSYICSIICGQRYVHTIELSNTHLKPKSLCQIADALIENMQGIKNLNLSYNFLWTGRLLPEEPPQPPPQPVSLLRKPEPAPPKRISDEEYAHKFIDKMAVYLQKSYMLNHLNFSGLQLGKFDHTKVLLLLGKINECANLLTVHLSDNDLMKEKKDMLGSNFGVDEAEMDQLDKFEEVIGAFGLKYRDVHPKQKCRLKQTLDPEKKVITYSDMIKKAYMNQILTTIRKRLHGPQNFGNAKRKSSRKKKEDDFGQDAGEETFNRQDTDQRTLQLETYTMAIEHQQKFLTLHKLLNESLINRGMGRTNYLDSADQFIVHRNTHHPELIFNQNHTEDLFAEDRFDRYFSAEESTRWQFTKQPGDCQTCNRHVYTVIFFDKVLRNNTDLVQIKDASSLEIIRKHFEKDVSSSGHMPMICGSVVNQNKKTALKQESQGFERNLKMMRADIFSMLSVSHVAKFVKRVKQNNRIREGIFTMLQADDQLSSKADNEDVHLVSETDKLLFKFNGWNKVLADKCLKNELEDIKRINFPQRICDPTFSELKDEQIKIWAYAGFLAPGLHQFIIYDQESNTAWCKELVIDLNNQPVCFPELPKQIGGRNFNIPPQVWNPWKEDSEHNISMAIVADTAIENFELELFIKNKGPKKAKSDGGDPLKEIMDALTNNFDIIKIFQKELMVKSQKYPDIDFASFIDRATRMHYSSEQAGKEDCHCLSEKDQEKKKEMAKELRSKLELIFMRSTRNDKEGGLGGGMCRGELLEAIVRCAQINGQANQPAQNLRLYINDCIKPIAMNSQVTKIRKIIRKSKLLNQLLHDNRQGLMLIYNDYKRPVFCQKQAHKLFNTSGAGVGLNLSGNKMNGLHETMVAFAKVQQKRVPIELQNLQYELIDEKDLKKCFCFSMMTVLNEKKFQKKHNYLIYIEFLEMVCRVAYKINSEPIDIAQKVYILLEKLYTRRYNLGLNTAKTDKTPGDLNLVPIAKKVEESDDNEDDLSV